MRNQGNFHLCEGAHHVKKEPAHRVAFVGVNILRDGDEADAKGNKFLDAAN